MKKHQAIEAMLLDMDGVFYVGDEVFKGAAETLRALQNNQIPYRFITNTTTKTRRELLGKLEKLGLTASEDQIFTAVTATVDFLKQYGTPSCHLLVSESVKSSFETFPKDDNKPDFVVLGDIGSQWDYDILNRVFNMVMNGSRLIAIHRNKYWQEGEGLRLDVGAFVAALEYVCDCKATVIGKPSAEFFTAAMRSMEKVAIIGDDIDSDIGGGQAMGLRGILVRTGKFRESLLEKSEIEPDYVIDSIAGLPALLNIET